MDTGTDLAVMDDMDAIVAAFNADDSAALMEASGQSVKQTGQKGLPRININYDAETEDARHADAVVVHRNVVRNATAKGDAVTFAHRNALVPPVEGWVLRAVLCRR